MWRLMKKRSVWPSGFWTQSSSIGKTGLRAKDLITYPLGRVDKCQHYLADWIRLVFRLHLRKLFNSQSLARCMDSDQLKRWRAFPVGHARCYLDSPFRHRSSIILIVRGSNSSFKLRIFGRPHGREKIAIPLWSNWYNHSLVLPWRYQAQATWYTNHATKMHSPVVGATFIPPPDILHQFATPPGGLQLLAGPTPPGVWDETYTRSFDLTKMPCIFIELWRRKEEIAWSKECWSRAACVLILLIVKQVQACYTLCKRGPLAPLRSPCG